MCLFCEILFVKIVTIIESPFAKSIYLDEEYLFARRLTSFIKIETPFLSVAFVLKKAYCSG